MRVKTSVHVAVSLHSKLCKVRAIHRISQSAEFTTAFDGASEGEREAALLCIENCDQPGLEQWILGQLISKSQLDLVPVTELRKLGKQLGVRGYHVATKCTLITEIRKAENARNSIGCNPQSPPGNAALDLEVRQGQ